MYVKRNVEQISIFRISAVAGVNGRFMKNVFPTLLIFATLAPIGTLLSPQTV